jgi:DNA-binding response OmpR family regulator
MVREYHPDVVVLDVMLPDINGKEVCQRIRQDPALADVRVICISGMVEEDKIADLLASGANEFLQKPFEVEQLVELMCKQLDVEPIAVR